MYPIIQGGATSKYRSCLSDPVIQHLKNAHRTGHICLFCNEVINNKDEKYCLRSYLESLTEEEKRDLLHLNVGKFIKYTEDGDNDDILLEAMLFAAANHTWKCWSCPSCNFKSGDSESHLKHVLTEHVGILSEHIKESLPQKVSDDKFSYSNWEPIGVKDNADRNRLLQSIRDIIGLFIKYESLTESHLEYIIAYTKEEASNFIDEKNQGCTHCLRFLDACQLREIVDFLQSLAKACDLEKYQICCSSLGDEVIDDEFGCEVLEERICLDHNSSKLILDSLRIPELSTAGGMISWSESGTSWKHQFSAWRESRNSRGVRGRIILQELKNEFNLLRELCTKRREQLIYIEALGHEESICRDALEKTQQIKQSCYAIVRNNGEAADKLTTKIAFNVVIEALHMLWIDDVTSTKGTYIKSAVQKLKLSESKELAMLDASIVQSLAKTKRLELMLGPASYSNYLTVIVPVAKSFLQMHIKEAGEKFFGGEYKDETEEDSEQKSEILESNNASEDDSQDATEEESVDATAEGLPADDACSSKISSDHEAFVAEFIWIPIK